MLFANDENGKKTFIDETKNGQDYYCPSCDEKLICKFGKIKSHHFAHQKGSFCKDSWHYDMSEWHSAWQSLFPQECQEVVYTYKGEKHRADVAIGKIVVEFQHSRISVDEFLNRNIFYHSLGMKIIWIFDCFNGDIIDFDWDLFAPREENTFCIKKRNEIFTEDVIWKSADAIFFSEDYNDETEKPEHNYWLHKISWFWNRNDRQRFKTVFGVEACYNDEEFLKLLTGELAQEKEPRTGTITYLWRKNRIKRWGIFENEKGFRVKVIRNPALQYERYGKMYGFFSAPKKMHFSRDSKQVWGMGDEWKLLRYE